MQTYADFKEMYDDTSLLDVERYEELGRKCDFYNDLIHKIEHMINETNRRRLDRNQEEDWEWGLLSDSGEYKGIQFKLLNTEYDITKDW